MVKLNLNSYGWFSSPDLNISYVLRKSIKMSYEISSLAEKETN